MIPLPKLKRKTCVKRLITWGFLHSQSEWKRTEDCHKLTLHDSLHCLQCCYSQQLKEQYKALLHFPYILQSLRDVCILLLILSDFLSPMAIDCESPSQRKGIWTPRLGTDCLSKSRLNKAESNSLLCTELHPFSFRGWLLLCFSHLYTCPNLNL